MRHTRLGKRTVAELRAMLGCLGLDRGGKHVRTFLSRCSVNRCRLPLPPCCVFLDEACFSVHHANAHPSLGPTGEARSRADEGCCACPIGSETRRQAGIKEALGMPTCSMRSWSITPPGLTAAPGPKSSRGQPASWTCLQARFQGCQQALGPSLRISRKRASRRHSRVLLRLSRPKRSHLLPLRGRAVWLQRTPLPPPPPQKKAQCTDWAG